MNPPEHDEYLKQRSFNPPPQQWQREYLCEWIPGQKERALRKLAAQYHEITEDYDRSVCSQVNQDGIAIPANGEEFTLINRNAKDVFERLFLEVRDLGFDRKQFHQAISNYRKR